MVEDLDLKMLIIEDTTNLMNDLDLKYCSKQVDCRQVGLLDFDLLDSVEQKQDFELGSVLVFDFETKQLDVGDANWDDIL